MRVRLAPVYDNGMQQELACHYSLNAICLPCSNIGIMSSFVNSLFDSQIVSVKGEFAFELSGQRIKLLEIAIAKTRADVFPFAEFLVDSAQELANLQRKYEFFLYKCRQESLDVQHLNLQASKQGLELTDPSLNLWRFCIA